MCPLRYRHQARDYSLKTESYTLIFTRSLSCLITSSLSWRNLLTLEILSPRPISIGQLNASLHLHFRPINLVTF